MLSQPLRSRLMRRLRQNDFGAPTQQLRTSHAKRTSLRKLPAGSSNRTSVGLGSTTRQCDRLELSIGHEYANEAGRHWLIEKPLERIWPASTHYLSKWRTATAEKVIENPDLAALKQHLSQTVFLDLETCGFAGSMIFLAGLLYESSDGPKLAQLWARNYAEEAAVLATLRQIMGGKKILATFNGKSFDWPQVRDRCTIHARDAELPQPLHVDLLHHSRRRFKHELPNCKLQTLEQYVCGRRRVGDIPGSQIPEEYHHYVRTGDTRSVRSILHHNALDLVTLMQLSLVLTKAS